MAIHNPSNLYSGNAVVLNSQQSVNFATQLLAKQQAKRDALNQYYSKQQGDLADRENKMRPQDLSDPANPNRGWAQGLNDLQTFYLNPDNKRAIVAPKTPQDYQIKNQYDAQYNKLLSDARTSSAANEDRKVILSHVQSGKFNPTDEDQDLLHHFEMSIYNPDRQLQQKDPQTGFTVPVNPDISNLSVNIPAFDAGKQNQFDKAAIGKVQAGKVYDETKARKDPTTGDIYVPFKQGYQPDQIKSIANNASQLASVKNTSANVYYSHLKDDPTFVTQANPVFQSVYGATNADGTPNNIDTPEKAAQADYLVKAAQSGKTGEDKVTDWQQKQRLSQQFAQAQQARGNQNTISHIKLAAGLRQDAKTNDDVTGVDAVLRGIYDNMSAGEKSATGTTLPEWMKGNVNLQNNVIPVNDPDVMKQFEGLRKIGTTPVNPDGITYDKNKKQFNLIYNAIPQKDANGKDIAPIPAASIPLSEADYAKAKVKEMYGAKGMGNKNEILSSVINHDGGLYNSVQKYNPTNQTKPSTTVSVKPTVTKKEINRSDIPTKAAAAGYSPKEYEQILIKNGVNIK